VWSLVFIVVLAVGSLAATIISGATPLLGLDLKGGVSVVLKPTGTANSAQLDESVRIIQNRVNGLGVSNSDVARQGSDVVINLPGIKDSQAALAELGQTATLYFRPVYCEIPNYAPPTKSPTGPATTAPSSKAVPSSPTSAPPATTAARVDTTGSVFELDSAHFADSSAKPATPATSTASSGSTQAALGQAYCSSTASTSIPTTPVSADLPDKTVVLPDYTHSIRYVLGPADMTGASIANAFASLTSTGQYVVNLTFTSKGAVTFDQIAAKRYQCYQQDPANPPFCALEAVELDGVVQSAPVIQAPSFNGQATISGAPPNGFTPAQANQLALVLKYGSLPIRFVPQSVQTVSATVGKDSLRAGLLAGIGGIAVVMIYMLLYYRLLGLVVLVGLGVGGSLLYSIITVLSQTKGLTLTLAGVTGIIVSVGITVDSYVVYFERLKDEVRAGRSVRQSTEKSFSRAFRTVLTADLVSFMAALILYLLTVGDVRGFAFTLGLSTLLDVFTAWFFIRPAVVIVGRRRAFTENRVFGIARGLGARPAGGAA